MNEPRLICQDERRHHQVRRESFNGLDYLEVSDNQLTLTVYFLGKAPESIRRENVRISGGRRIRGITVTDLRLCIRDDPEQDDCMIVTVDKPGDFSTYRLCLVDLDDEVRIDPRYACLDFSFKVGCPSDLDCRAEAICPPEEREEAAALKAIDYLAKDYASFRQLILDRLALIMPDWQERHVPDVGLALVELLAYVGDHLSYHQDAVATEAYLETARQRISVRRHARLVDYAMHEGCNARAWVHIHTSQDQPLDADEVTFITGVEDVLRSDGRPLTPDDIRSVPTGAYEVFEPIAVHTLQLYEAHNRISLYPWGDAECCLPAGTTSATLRDHWVVETPDEEEPGSGKPPAEQAAPDQYEQDPAKPQAGPPAAGPSAVVGRELDQLNCGDFLLFEEVIGPETGNPADADPRRRHVVRLTHVERREDPLITEAPEDAASLADEKLPVPVVEIAWAEADALPFPLCISTIGPPPACELLKDVSVARGNMILVDHGRRIEGEDLGTVPVAMTEIPCGDACRPADVRLIAGDFGPRLEEGPLIFSRKPSGPLPEEGPAAGLLIQEPRQARPWIDLRAIPALPDGSDTLFDAADLEDPTPLATQLLKLNTPAASYLWNRVSRKMQEMLAEEEDADAPSHEVLAQLVDELRGLIQHWHPRSDLLSSEPDDAHFLTEIDNWGRARLRFGDGELGQIPQAGSRFLATYRVGEGPAGNVGAEAISHVVLRRTRLSGITLRPRNPLPAQGGTAPEPLTDVKLFAPHAFRDELQRAIIADDYAAIVVRDFADQVQRAAAALRWTGSWYEVVVAVDPRGEIEPDPELLREIERHLRAYRRIGHDLAVEGARHVPLDLKLTVCVSPDYLRGHVKAELLKVFSNRRLPDNRLGFFHPDSLTFGEGIFLSELVAAAQAVPGVENIIVDRLERRYEGPNHEIGRGVLPLGPMEVARLDNDPSFPENGRLTLSMEGGR
mgnify:CR=1 FL=1